MKVFDILISIIFEKIGFEFRYSYQIVIVAKQWQLQ